MPAKMYGRVSFNMMVTILTASLISAIISALLAIPLGGPFYHYMMSRIDISAGSPGSRAEETIPLVQTLEEARRSDLFTVVMPKHFLNDYTILDDTYYVRVHLPSGETIPARINRKNVEELDYDVRLPVGTLKEWKKTGKLKSDYELVCYEGYYTDPDHYIDMLGDFDRIPTEVYASGRLFRYLFLFFQLGISILIRRYGVKHGWFPPELFRKKYVETERSTIPQDDTERWILGTYAMWAGYLGNENLIAGFPKNPKNQKAIRKIYETDWDLKNVQDYKDIVAQLTAEGGYNGTDQASYAWDWCRAMQIIGCGFFCDFFTRQEMREMSCQIGYRMQRQFSSWEDLCENYLDGYTRWIRSIGRDPVECRAEREEIYARIKNNPNSPYQLFFNMPLMSKPALKD